MTYGEQHHIWERELKARARADSACREARLRDLFFLTEFGRGLSYYPSKNIKTWNWIGLSSGLLLPCFLFSLKKNIPLKNKYVLL